MIDKDLKLFKALIITINLVLLSSCGYFSDDPVEGAEVFTSESLSGGCQINVDELALILEKDIQSEINCLEDNLLKFSRYVRSDDANSVSAPELSTFVTRFFEGQASLIVDSIGLIFDLNRLFLQDADGSISNENIKPLFDLLRVANLRLSQMNKGLSSYQVDELSKSKTKALIKGELSNFSQEITQIIKSRAGRNVSSLDLNDFIGKVEQQFSAIEIDGSTFKLILSLKKLLLGGEDNILTRDQLFVLLKDLPELGSLAFNIMAEDPRIENDRVSFFTELKDNVSTLEGIYFEHESEETIFTNDQVLNLITSSFSLDSELYIELVKRFKEDILNIEEDSDFNFRDIKNISSLSKAFLEGLVFSEKIKNVSSDSEEWGDDKELFLKSFENLRMNLTKNFNDNTYFPKEVKLFSFISFLSEKFDSFSFDTRFVDFAEIGKLSLVGGEKSFFTKLELLNLLKKFKELGASIYDLSYSSGEIHSAQKMSGIYFRALKSVRPLIGNEKNLELITLKKVISHASNILENEDFLDYLEAAKKVKGKVLGGKPSSISVHDMKQVITLAEAFFGKRYYLDLSYDLYKEELESANKISSLAHRHHPQFNEFSKDQVKEYREELFDIVSKFKLFRFDDGSQFYGMKTKRSKKGLVEIFSIRYLFNIFAETFGHRESETELLALSIEELNDLIFTFKPILEDLGLWSKYPETFARNTLLLADLFQGMSDGSMSVNAYEATEYGALVLFAIQAADEMTALLKNHCPEVEAKGSVGFTLKCYRPLFFKTFLNDQGLATKLPKLNKYIESISEEERSSFLISIEGFARDDQDPERPQSRRDLVLLIGALLNIESTFLRYDTDDSNLLEPEELDRAFPVYRGALIDLAGLEEDKYHFAKTIFSYMIKYMKIPGKLQVANYHYNPLRSKKVSSERLNIGALLYSMVIGIEEE